jgi:hypothetical protein
MTVSFGSNKLVEDVDMASSFQSDIINLTQKNGFSIHTIFTGAPVGSFYVAVSIDNSNWAILEGSTQAITASGDIFYNVDSAKYLSARLHYVFTSGTGTANAFYSTREAI